ncbi:MAG: magnesium transporter CorA family protein [Ruminococcus sp.]|jgi:magnesium transporter|nr:magnesium transporter CorA family protein [Ruminococcus sp.]
MLNIYKTDKGVLNEVSELQPNVWVKMTAPDAEENQHIVDHYGIDFGDLVAALDDEESSRIEFEDNYTLILVDIPITEIRNDEQYYTTIPLGIIVTEDAVITICRQEVEIFGVNLRFKMRNFSTAKKMRFVYHLLYSISRLYLYDLRNIDKARTEIEERAGKETKDTDIISLHELESSLVYFATSLRANNMVITRLMRNNEFPEDEELIEDTIIENNQAIEMATIYRDIIDSTRELISAVMDNQLNNVMKYLTSITIVMAIPTVISGIYGMNLKWLPFANTIHGFGIVCLATAIICLITMIILRRKKMM